MRVSWMGRRTNYYTHEEIRKERELLRIITRKKMKLLCHVMRRKKLENLSLTGRSSGGRGRSCMKYMHDHKDVGYTSIISLG